MTVTLADDLAVARAERRRVADPVEVVLDVVAERFGIDRAACPRPLRGYKSAWDGGPMDMAAKLLYQALSLTKARVADELRCSPGTTAIGNCHRSMSALDLEALDELEARAPL